MAKRDGPEGCAWVLRLESRLRLPPAPPAMPRVRVRAHGFGLSCRAGGWIAAGWVCIRLGGLGPAGVNRWRLFVEQRLPHGPGAGANAVQRLAAVVSLDGCQVLFGPSAGAGAECLLTLAVHMQPQADCRASVLPLAAPHIKEVRARPGRLLGEVVTDGVLVRGKVEFDVFWVDGERAVRHQLVRGSLAARVAVAGARPGQRGQASGRAVRTFWRWDARRAVLAVWAAVRVEALVTEQAERPVAAEHWLVQRIVGRGVAWTAVRAVGLAVGLDNGQPLC